MVATTTGTGTGTGTETGIGGTGIQETVGQEAEKMTETVSVTDMTGDELIHTLRLTIDERAGPHLHDAQVRVFVIIGHQVNLACRTLSL